MIVTRDLDTYLLHNLNVIVYVPYLLRMLFVKGVRCIFDKYPYCLLKFIGGIALEKLPTCYG